MLDKNLRTQLEELKDNGYKCSHYRSCTGSFKNLFSCFLNVQIKLDIEKTNIKFSNNVQIFIPHNYPKKIPIVYDTIDNIIPKKDDYHVSEDGSLCLEHPINLYFKFNKQRTLLFFIQEFVESFYYNYYHKEKYGVYPYGEFSHGNRGHIEAISEFFNANKTKACNMILDGKELKKYLPDDEIKSMQTAIKATNFRKKRNYRTY